MIKKLTSLFFKVAFLFLLFTTPVKKTYAQGNALAFDKPDQDYVIAGPAGGLYTVGSAYTKEAWVLKGPYHTAENFISCKDPFFIEYDQLVNNSNNYIIPSQEHYDVVDTSRITPGRWVHYAVTYDGATTMKLYRNGNLVVQNNAVPFTSASGQNYVGAFFNTDTGLPDYFFWGHLDQIRVYNVALTQAQIRTNMVNTTSVLPGNLKAYYNFNSGTGGANNAGVTQLTDQSGNGNHGTLMNFDLTGTNSNWVESYAMIIPTSNAATNVTQTSFDANWTPPAFGGASMIDRYYVYVSTTPDFENPIPGSYFNVPFGTNTLHVSGLSPNTNYYYMLVADKDGAVANQGALTLPITVKTLNVLAVNMLNFNASKTNSGNLLQWSTASEQNNKTFEVQRSENGTDFTTITTINGSGNSSTTKNYQYTDAATGQAAVYYYRLKMVDINGGISYSEILLIKNSKGGGAITVYPNPAKDKVTVNITDKSLMNTTATVVDISGKQLQQVIIKQTVTSINLSTYARGIYLLKLANGESVKLVKE
ncbi:LamG-like jellyroll fold domain-containing protein [Ferruginibacter sp.]